MDCEFNLCTYQIDPWHYIAAFRISKVMHRVTLNFRYDMFVLFKAGILGSTQALTYPLIDTQCDGITRHCRQTSRSVSYKDFILL